MGISSPVERDRGSLEVCELVRSLEVSVRSTHGNKDTSHLNEQFRSADLPGGVPRVRYYMELKLRPDFLQFPSRRGLIDSPRQNNEERRVEQPRGPTGHTTSYLP